MRYLGGKIKQAKWLANTILPLVKGRSIYVEPFVGGGAILEVMAPHFKDVLASDIVLDLILLYQALQNGWLPPITLSKDEYIALKNSNTPSALRAWAGFAASYNGKWFAGYGPKAVGRDYLAESHRAILRKAKNFQHVVFEHCSYETHTPDNTCVVYCDPPYANTEGYQAAGIFDHKKFWLTMETWREIGALVLVTEYTAPIGWQVLSSINRKETLNHSSQSSGIRQENLYFRP